MTLFAVFCLSSSSLLFELILTRYFAIAHGNHLSFMVIGIAMLGYGASGTLFALAAGRRERSDLRTAFPVVSLACAASTAGSFLLVRLIPLDYLRFPIERLQFLYLLVSILLLALPFFFAGLGTCIAYVSSPGASGLVAAASMAGSGLGAIAPAILLPSLDVGGAIAAAALLSLLPALASAFAAGPSERTAPSLGMIALAVCLAAAISLSFVWGRDRFFTVPPSPYMALPQLLQTPNSRVTAHAASIRGTFDAVESPALRFAPGLSLGFSGTLPSQRAIIRDGDELTVASDLSSGGGAAFARWSHSFAGYILAGSPSASLVIQSGGGLGVACAFASGSRRILLVVEQPEVSREMVKVYAPLGIEVVAENPRSLVARGGERFDTIHVEDWGPSLPGMASLAEDALLTVDAFRAYWRRLSDHGVLIVSRRIVLPPSDSLRLFSTALLALVREGVEKPEERLVVVRNWDTCSILVSRGQVRGAPAAAVVSFAKAASFDLDWFPGIGPEDTNRFNRLPGAPFFEAFSAIAKDPGFAATYFLDVSPQGDERPFPNRFIRWTRIGEYFRAMGARTYSLLLSGEMVALAVLAQALLLSIPLLLPPLLSGRGRFPLRLLVLFMASGMGFLFAEIAFLDSFTLLYSNPFVTLSIVLGGLLVSSGVGGLIADRLSRKMLGPISCAIALVLLLLGAFLTRSMSLLLPLPPVARTAACIGLLAVPGFLLGIPFPLGMRFEAAGDAARSFAWAANGCASVIASAAAAIIAMSRGVGALFAVGAVAYALLSIAAFRALSARRRLPAGK